MAFWSRNKTPPENVNGGNEYVKGDNNSVEMINIANNNGFYAVDISDSTKVIVDNNIQDNISFKMLVTMQQNTSNINANNALTNSNTALTKAISVENRANNGEFNGRDGTNAFVSMGVDEPSNFSSLQVLIL